LNLDDAAIVLRPRSLGEIIDLALRLCSSAAFGLYTRLGLLVLLPAYAACLSLRYALSAPWAIVWLAALLVLPIVEAVFTVAVGRLIFEPNLAPRAVFAHLRKRRASFAFVLIARLVGLVVGILPFFILLPFVAYRFLLLDEACLLEGLSGKRAYDRSVRLAFERGADALFVLVILLGVRLVGVVAAELLADGLVSGLLLLGRPFGWLFSDGGSPASLAGLFLTVPLVATARFLFYIDTRTRSDGWDIQLRFKAIGARAAEARRSAA